jgi:hypothetical protein
MNVYSLIAKVLIPITIEILTEDLELILDNMPLNERNGIVFQQDGATPHNAIRNREVLMVNLEKTGWEHMNLAPVI